MKWVKRLLLLMLLVLLSQIPFLYALFESYRLHRYLQALPQAQVASAPFQDLRGGIHVHSAAGGHSLGTYPEIIAAAKRAGYRYVFITEHPRPVTLFSPIYDSAVVMIYGREQALDETTRVLCDRAGGICFLSDTLSDQIPEHLTGIELFNLHESARHRDTWYNRINFLYHRLAYGDLFFFRLWQMDPRRFQMWDRRLAAGLFTGIAGSDAHQNVGVVLQTTAGRRLLSLMVDPYEESFRAVSTHVMLPLNATVSEASILDALRNGSVYVAFERIRDSTGFSFHAEQDGRIWPMGSQVQVGARLVLQAPTPARFILMRDGRPRREFRGAHFSVDVDQPGVYRLETYPLDPPSSLRGKPWIIANPIQVVRP